MPHLEFFIYAFYMHSSFSFLGKFDLNAGIFSCTKGSFQRNADKFDYVNSSFWPGDCENPVSIYLFAEEVIRF